MIQVIKFNKKISQVGSDIGNVGKILDKSGVVLDLRPAIAPIDTAIKNAAKVNNTSLFNSLNNVKTALLHEMTPGTTAPILDEAGKVIQEGTPTIVKGNPKNIIAAGYDEAKQFLSDIASHTRFTGNPSDDKALNMATKQAYGVARDIMNKGADSVDHVLGKHVRDLNERYGDLLSAQNAIDHRDLILKRQNFLNLADKFSIPLAVGSSIATALVTGDFAKAGIVLASELGGIAAVKAGGSTAVKTRVAQFLSKLAPEERSGILNSTPVLKNLYERVTGQAAPKTPPNKTP